MSARHGRAPQLKVWLRKHRGASDRTIKLYARDATRLIAALGDEPDGWEPAAIRSFFLDRASHCGNGTVEKLTTSLRAFLRVLRSKAAAEQVSPMLFLAMPIGGSPACRDIWWRSR